MLNPIELLQLGFSFSFLAYASYSDIKTMEVSNNVWKLYGPTIAILMTINILFFKPDLAALAFINVGLTFIVALALWQLRIFGGADTKCLTCIGLGHFTSLLVLGYTGVMMASATIATHGKRKAKNIPLIPFLTLALGLVTVQAFI